MNKTHIAMMSAAMLLASCSTNNGNQDAGDTSVIGRQEITAGSALKHSGPWDASEAQPSRPTHKKWPIPCLTTACLKTKATTSST